SRGRPGRTPRARRPRQLRRRRGVPLLCCPREALGACPGIWTGRVPDAVEQAPCASACWRLRLERRQTPDKNISDRRGPEPESIRKMRLASLTLDLRHFY